MSDESDDAGGLATFNYALGKWEREGSDVPEITTIETVDGEPYVFHQTDDDSIENREATATALRKIMGGCAGAMKTADYEVEQVHIFVLPDDREKHPGGARFRLESEWVRELKEAELSIGGLLERVDDTMELVEDINDLGVDIEE